MKKTLIVLLMAIAAMSLVFAASPETVFEKFSYVAGYVYAANGYPLEVVYYLPNAYYGVDAQFAYNGYMDVMNASVPYTVDELNSFIAAYNEEIAGMSEANLKEATAFLAENGKKKEVTTTKSGLQYQILREGTGDKPSMADTVEVDYQLTLLDGSIVDSSYARGAHSSFPLSGVVSGFAEGLTLLKQGGKIRIWVHPDLGYGPDGSGSIQGNSLLIFDIELYSITKPEK